MYIYISSKGKVLFIYKTRNMPLYPKQIISVVILTKQDKLLKSKFRFKFGTKLLYLSATKKNRNVVSPDHKKLPKNELNNLLITQAYSN